MKEISRARLHLISVGHLKHKYHDLLQIALLTGMKTILKLCPFNADGQGNSLIMSL